VNDAGGEARNVSVTQRELALFAHEVRGALTVISGYSEIMRRSLSEQEREKALEGIAHAVKRIDRLVYSALEGSLDDQGPDELLDLADLAEGVVAEQRAISGRQVELRASARPTARVAPEALERALGNLIGNSLKYSLSNSAVEVGVDVAGAMAQLSVADRGPGIPEEERERVLEPFERLEEHRDTPGTGLGLTVVRSIAESHGGRVSISDRPGGGTVVTVEIPVAT